jgi:hypothetical protein
MKRTIYWVRDLLTGRIARYFSRDAAERVVEREQYFTIHEFEYQDYQDIDNTVVDILIDKWSEEKGAAKCDG